MILNAEQSKGLANFFFDLAKGLTLGAALSTTIGPVELRLFISAISIIFAYFCVKLALTLLENI